MWLSPEYQALPVEQKAEFVWQYGTYLMCRCKGRYVVTLHEWENFFIEVWLDAVAQRVCMLFTFHGTAQLKPYLDKLPPAGRASTSGEQDGTIESAIFFRRTYCR